MSTACWNVTFSHYNNAPPPPEKKGEKSISFEFDSLTCQRWTPEAQVQECEIGL